ncbi:tripartite motif-containing protein 16-like [Trichomycterus rosablanca]|uniref:tripartite motif-containing protein 16-like n=1 Tax=Trichomycterus rosablanca TaxID=2290929 RepID=UPI002F358FFD
MIRNLLKSKLNRNEQIIKQLEVEIVNIKRRVTKLEELSHTKDPTQFLQRFQSLPVSTEMEDSPSITAVHHLSFDQMRKSLTDLKNGLEKFCKKEFTKIIPHDFCYLTLDPDTTHRNLTLSEDNRVVTHSWSEQPYTDHPERFDYYWQVLSKEPVSGRCYWEVEWNSLYAVSLAVSYKAVSRKGHGRECEFGRNTWSWCLECSASCLSFWHNNIRTKLQHFSPPRIGVYVDHSAGTLSFYSVSDTMTLLHSVQTQFTQPLYAGFGVYWGMGTLLSFLSNVGSTIGWSVICSIYIYVYIYICAIKQVFQLLRIMQHPGMSRRLFLRLRRVTLPRSTGSHFVFT